MVLNEKEVELKYNFILERLLRTISVYAVSFDDLSKLTDGIKELSTKNNSLPYLIRLDMICHYVQFMAKRQFILKLFYEALEADFIALKENKFDLNCSKVYWE